MFFLAALQERVLLQMIHRLGKEINHPDSIYYWAYKHNIPVYCPALTDGSLGDMLYFHTFKNPGLVLDIVADIRSMNDEAMKAPPRKTGVIILGGGMCAICIQLSASFKFSDLQCCTSLPLLWIAIIVFPPVEIMCCSKMCVCYNICLPRLHRC